MAVERLLSEPPGLQVGWVVLSVLSDVGTEAQDAHPVHLLGVVPGMKLSSIMETDDIRQIYLNEKGILASIFCFSSMISSSSSS